MLFEEQPKFLEELFSPIGRERLVQIDVAQVVRRALLFLAGTTAFPTIFQIRWPEIASTFRATLLLHLTSIPFLLQRRQDSSGSIVGHLLRFLLRLLQRLYVNQ